MFRGVIMALHIDKNGRIKTISPPQKLTDKEKERLEKAAVNRNLIKKSLKINFNIVDGEHQNH